MLLHEPDQFGARSVVGELGWNLFFEIKHCVKEDLAKAASLDLGIDVKIEDAEWLHFDKRVAPCSDEQFLESGFNKADTLVALRFKEARVVICSRLRKGRDHRWKSLSLC